MGLSSLLEKTKLSSGSKPETAEPTSHLAGGGPDGNDADSDNDDGEDAADHSSRTYTLYVHNSTTHPVQIVAWPVQASQKSDFELTTYRGAKKHTTVPANGTIFTQPEFELATSRGPKKFDLRDRWCWVYFDLVTPERPVHLQAYVQLNRKGIEAATLGRTDIDSTKDDSQSSGAVGRVEIDNSKKHIRYFIDDQVAQTENIVDDSTKKASLTKLGKGISINTYVSLYKTKASVIAGKEARYHEYTPPEPPSRLGVIRASTHEIEGTKAKTAGVWVEYDGKPWFDGHVKMHPVTGITRGQGLNSTAESTAIFAEHGVISYGFHDAGTARRNQLYAYVTPRLDNWLGDLINNDPAWLQVPFCKLALPGAHDAGMYGPIHGGLTALIQEGHFGHALKSGLITNIASPVVRGLVDLLESFKLSPNRVLSNMALTQKDTIESQLGIGVRFFDFRPGWCFHDVIHTRREKLYHQHAIVPGCTYESFLTSILEFLATHPREIVVIELKDDGFAIKSNREKDGQVVVYTMVPTEEELSQDMERARLAAKASGAQDIVIGDASDMAKPIGEILKANRRLLLIDRVHHPDQWKRNDSYDHVAYNTDEPAPIIAALEKTLAESSKPEPAAVTGTAPRGCIYQLQGTPTSDLMDDLKASLTYSDSSSLLTYIKPKMDRVTYPWLASHEFHEPGTIVLLQDFVEGVLVEHAIDISRRRAGLV
ncbi:hypothetical protein OIV83_005737 [Microbotryomycetes sp. JL201]|nr:hypothetical protein OIV83_005737 [Microbotryomycetes sp. JL201]